MIIEKRLITPEVAAEMLARNAGNRPLRPHTVKAYATDMAAGKWRLTHEPLAVTTSGNLINGQHRLTALVQSGCTQEFWVAVYDTAETAMDLPIDFGARRTVSDILKQDKIYVQTAAAVFRYVIARQGAEVRPFQAQAILEAIGTEVTDAANVSRSRGRMTGSAMARAAVVCNLIAYRDDAELYQEIIESFRGWVAGENALWASVEALNKQMRNILGSFRPNTFCRVAYAFNPKNRDSRVIRVSTQQQDALLNEMREMLKAHMPNLFPVSTK